MTSVLASGSAGSTGSSGVTSMPVTIPVGAWPDGQVGTLVVYTLQPTNGNTIATPPAGFPATPSFEVSGNSSVRTVAWHKALTDSDRGTTVQPVWSASNATVTGWAAIDGIVTEVVPGTGGQSGTAVPTVPAGTAVDATSVGVLHVVGYRNNVADGSVTSLTGWTGSPTKLESVTSARTGSQRNGGVTLSHYSEGPAYALYSGVPPVTYSHAQGAFLFKSAGAPPADIATTTGLTLSSNSATVGTNVTATATVTPGSGGAAAGSIKFETNTGSGWTTLSTVALAGGTAQAQVPVILGDTSVRATYLPSAGWTGSVSPTVIVTGTAVVPGFGLDVKAWNGTAWVASEMRTQTTPGVWDRREVKAPGAGLPAGSLLLYKPPTLSSPITITVPTGLSKYTAAMNSGQDYIVKLPSTGRGQVILQGGRNVVLIGGEIQNDPSNANDNTADSANRGIYITNGSNTGSTGARTIHIEGVLFTGPHFSDLIQIADRAENNLTVQLQNLRAEGTTYGAETRPPWAHSDAVQCYGGPAVLKLNKCSFLNNTYQGLFANDGDGRTVPTGHQPWEFHQVHFVGSTNGPDPPERYLLTDIQGPRATNTSDVYVGRTSLSNFSPSDSYAGCAAWDWHDGVPPGGTYVPSGVAGVNYVSPGYV